MSFESQSTSTTTDHQADFWALGIGFKKMRQLGAADKAIIFTESKRNQARKRLFEAQDEIDAKRDQIIADIEGQLEVQEGE
jgi:hypothetical protein